MLLTVKGSLPDLSGTIRFNPDDLAASLFDISIGTSNIDTDNEKRDEHLRNEDFFHVAEYPKISFKSTSIHKENSSFLVKGNLTILETSKKISIPFDFDSNTFTGQFSLDRSDYGIGKKFPGFFISKNVQISIKCKTTL